MTDFHARSFFEAREYMAVLMAPCGAVTFEDGGAVWRDGDLIWRYWLECLATGEWREFSFTLGRVPLDASPRVFPQGPAPSELIDAGQWWELARRYGAASQEAQQRWAAGQQDGETAQAIVGNIGNARAALAEVVKFIPAGGQEPPESAFWTDLGRQIREQFRDQLTRPVLEKGIREADAVLDEADAETVRLRREAR